MKKKTGHKKIWAERIEDTFAEVAFAKAGEPFPRKPRLRPCKEEDRQTTVYVNDETPPGLCA